MKYGVYTWRRDGKYLNVEPVKTYKREKAAQNFCDKDFEKGNAGNYVVRELPTSKQEK